MEKALEGLGRFSVRFRWPVLAFWVVVTVLCVHFLPSLSSVVDTQNSAFLPSDQPSVQASHLEGPFQPTGGSQALLVASAAGGRALTAADQDAVSAAEAAIAKSANVTSVKDLATSQNGKARLASIVADVPISGSVADNEVASIRSILARPTIDGVEVPPGLTMHLAGPLAVSADNAHANKSAQVKTELLTYLIIIVILLLVYRSALGPLVNLIPAGIVLALAEPVVGSLAKAGLPVSSVTPIMMTVLILGAGTDYGLFLIMRFREELEGGLGPHDAVVAAMRQVGESVVYAGLTVSGALFCLIFSSFGVYQGLGPSLAIAILMMLLASVTLTPALLALFGTTTFWPSRITTGRHKEGLWARVAERCAGRPALTLTTGVVVLGVLAVGLVGFMTTGFSGGSSSPASSDSAKGLAVIDANFPASVTNPTDLILGFDQSVWTSPGGLEAVAQAAASFAARTGQISEVTGPLNPVGPRAPLTVTELRQFYELAQKAGYPGPPGDLPTNPPADLPAADVPYYHLYRAVAQFVSPNGRTVQYSVTLPTGDPTSAGSVAAMPALRELSATVAHEVGATSNGVYGLGPFSYDVENVANHDLLKVFPIVGLVILVLLALLLRSLVAPVFLLLSVALSYAATLGLTNLLFVHLGGQPGINFVLAFLLFVFLVALGEDYNILVMSRIREESLVHGTEPHGTRRSVVTAVGATGTTVTSAGIILAGTFGAVAIAGGSAQLAEIGVALALGILLDTFVVRTLLVPSTVQLLGRWTWWPSALFGAEGATAAPGAAGEPAPSA